MSTLRIMLYFWPEIMVASWNKISNPTSPTMSATACAVLALEVLWLSGASLMGWCIPIPKMLTGMEVMQMRSYWTQYIPNMPGVKDSLRA